MNCELRIKDRKTIAATAAIVLVVWISFVLLDSSLEKEVEVVINKGAGVYKVADVLEKEGIIGNKFVFIVFTLATGNEKKLQAGRYIFRPGATTPSVVYFLVSGLAESEDIEVTIPEGFNIFDIDKRLISLGLIKEGEFAKGYYRDEGRFFPDTYRFDRKTCSAERRTCVDEIAGKMLDNFENKTAEIFKNLKIQKQKEILIIASMLEKEARTETDMKMITGTMEKRLATGQKLEVDAAVAYGACLREFKVSSLKFKYCDVSQVPVGTEIKIDGLFNTYIRAGLPPSPISNPGITAIRAALNPVKSDYLYYLSTRDGSQTIYSKTLAEHAANRRKYLGL